jgi:2-methylisocitrate lyase-like PEP mutase family enzyme
VTTDDSHTAGLQYPTRDLREQSATFLAMHREGPVLTLPNAWDAESARMIEAAGARAIATTSAGVANALGYTDGEGMPVDVALAAIAEVTRAVSVPVTADLEAGYGDAFTTVRRAVGAGAVGANIEDELRPLDRSVALMESALAGAAAEGVDLVLNARTDVYLKDTIEPSRRFDEAVARGRAYLASGAACFFVPGLTDADAIAALVRELGWRRVSIMATLDGPHSSTWEAAGVARVSYGPYVYRAQPEDRMTTVGRLLAHPEPAATNRT